MPKAKPYSGAVEDQLAAQLLNSTGVTVDNVPIGDALLKAREGLTGLVERANSALEGSEFAPIVAEHLANKMGRRGCSQVYVAPSGGVMLDISYEEQPKRRPRAPRPNTVPLMNELKTRAKEMNVDISEFGIKRKKILEYLDKVEAGEIDPLEKTAPAPKPKPPAVQTSNDPPEEDPGPMSAGPDETRVTAPPDEPKPPKKGFVKTSKAIVSPVVVDMHPAGEDPRKREGGKSAKSQGGGAKGRSMRQLVKDAEEVSISDLLASDPPK